MIVKSELVVHENHKRAQQINTIYKEGIAVYESRGLWSDLAVFDAPVQLAFGWRATDDKTARLAGGAK